MAQTATDLVAALLPVLPFMQGAELTPEIGSVINSAKVSDHHAIIPTAAFAGNGLDGLPESDKKLMSLVCCKLRTARRRSRGCTLSARARPMTGRCCCVIRERSM